MLGSIPSQARERLLYDDAWWAAQYGRIYDAPQCRDIIANMDKLRALDRKFGLLNAPFAWAISMYGAKGECTEPAQDEAFAILTDLAERGEGHAALLLAQFYHIKLGPNAQITQSWIKRTKNAVPRIITKNWRKVFYRPLAKSFDKMAAPLSTELESIFSWGEDIIGGDPERVYAFGMDLLKRGKNPEDKVLGCRWLYAAEKSGHQQARYHLARMHILGDVIQQAPEYGSLWFYASVNKDENLDALIFASELFEKGDVFEQHLPNSYIALLRAQALGADVTERMKRLAAQLEPHQLEWAKKDAKNPKHTLAFMLSPDFKRPAKSGIAAPICKFLP